MEEKEIKRIIREAAKEAVSETLSGLGLSAESPHEMQADMLYLRKIREGSEFLALRAKASMIALLIPTFLYLGWEIIKDSLGR